ncbi:ArpU family phage packaging/lysis transcriptional regulator [Peribacillus sp. FSL K6-1552]|uniref:ArpU family phage packaging/lysis transcriptional regulator n=1 Tax=Peribacillus sp. FSL K6-1552 TaxID=2954514 RepID=UPI0030FA459E
MYRRSDMPVVGEKKTKREVEKAISEYRDFLITLPIFLMPKVTPSYSLVPPSNTNAFHSSTELERIEFEQNRADCLNKMHDAVNSLKDIEKMIIVKKYLLHEQHGYDLLIWTELGLGKTKYYAIKGEAMLRLAFALKIEVYKKGGVLDERRPTHS